MYSLYYPIKPPEHSSTRRKSRTSSTNFTLQCAFYAILSFSSTWTFFMEQPSQKGYYTLHCCFHLNTLFVMWLIMQKEPSGNLFVQSMFTTLPHNNLVMRTKQGIIRRLRDTESPQLSKHFNRFLKTLARLLFTISLSYTRLPVFKTHLQNFLQAYVSRSVKFSA